MVNYSKWENIDSDSDEEKATLDNKAKRSLSKKRSSDLPPEISARLCELSKSDPGALDKLDREIEEMKSRALRQEIGASEMTPSAKLKQQVHI